MIKSENKKLRFQTQKIIRFFSSNPYQTPCGVKISSSSAHILLLLLKKKDEVINQQILASELGLNKSSIARTCIELGEKGHIKIETLRDDRRNNVIILTAKGLKLAKKLENQGDLFFASVLKNIPSDKVGDVLMSLEILTEALYVTSQRATALKNLAPSAPLVIF